MIARPRPTRRQEQAVDAPPRKELRGVVERITYQNPENGFTVARLAPERRDAEAAGAADGDRLVALVGALPDLQPGEAIAAEGFWRNDPKRGWASSRGNRVFLSRLGQVDGLHRQEPLPQRMAAPHGLNVDCPSRSPSMHADH